MQRVANSQSVSHSPWDAPGRPNHFLLSTQTDDNRLAYVITIMNMILRGIEAPNIIHTNTLAENLADPQEEDRFRIGKELLYSAA